MAEPIAPHFPVQPHHEPNRELLAERSPCCPLVILEPRLGAITWVVLGAGHAGLPSAKGAAGLGAPRVALIERHLMDGPPESRPVPSGDHPRVAPLEEAGGRRPERFGGPPVAVDAEGHSKFAMRRMRRLRALA